MHPDWYQDGIDHIWQPYAQAKIAPAALPVVGASGEHIVLADGRRLIDAVSSWWCIPHGHQHPHLVAAAKAQLDAMPHVMFAGLAHEPAYRLAQRLAALMPEQALPRAFFSDSGSTAVEVALKMALQYWQNVGKPEKRNFLCLEYGYHGDTFGAMSVSDPAHGMHQAYAHNVVAHEALLVPHDAAALQAFEAHVRDAAHKTAALIVEPLVQGAGGIRFYEPEMLQAMAACCRAHDVLLIADEIMTGFGRAGAMFACTDADVTPDIMCIGKGLTGGMMTLAATMAGEHIYQAFYDDDINKALMHGPTFMANPLACAIANASLDLFEREPRMEQVQAIAQHCRHALEPLRRHTIVEDVRVRGAIAAVQLDANRFDPFMVRPWFVEAGCWLRPFKNVIYMMPPFTISAQSLQHVTDAVCRVVERLDKHA